MTNATTVYKTLIVTLRANQTCKMAGVETCHLLNMQPPVIMLICTFLDPKGLGACTSASKAMQATALDEHVWKVVCTREFPNVPLTFKPADSLWRAEFKERKEGALRSVSRVADTRRFSFASTASDACDSLPVGNEFAHLHILTGGISACIDYGHGWAAQSQPSKASWYAIRVFRRRQRSQADCRRRRNRRGCTRVCICRRHCKHSRQYRRSFPGAAHCSQTRNVHMERIEVIVA